MPTELTVSDLPLTVRGALPHVSRQVQPARAAPKGYQLGASTRQGTVLNFRNTGGWANVSGNWAAAVWTNSATFEAWIRTSSPASMTILLGSDGGAGAIPRISVGTNDQIGVFWNPGAGPGWTSVDTTPITDGQWHHIAVVFDNGAITFYKDGVATADNLTVSGAQAAGGALQLGAGLGSTTGFVGQLHNVRVWSTSRTAAQIQTNRWATLTDDQPGLTASITFDETNQTTVNAIGNTSSNTVDCTVLTSDIPTPTCALSFGGAAAELGFFWADQLNSSGATFECWLKMDPGAAGTDQPLMSFDNPDDVSPRFEYNSGDRLGFFWLGNYYQSTDTRPISDGRWHHVALVFDNGYLTFYKDGVATADNYQLPSQQLSGEVLHIGSEFPSTRKLNGLLYDVRVWNTARTATEISAFRYITLQGNEAGLVFVCDLRGADPTVPTTMVPINRLTGAAGLMALDVTVVPANLPHQVLPSDEWTFAVPGVTPVGPLLSAQGLLCTDNAAYGQTAGAFLRSLDLQSGEITWSYDALTYSSITDGVIPGATAESLGVAYVGVQTTDFGALRSLELHAVDAGTGKPVWDVAFATLARNYLARPVINGPLVYICVNQGFAPPIRPALLWTDIATGTTVGGVILDTENLASFMTEPVFAGTGSTLAFVGTVTAAESTVAAVPTAAGQTATAIWQVTTAATITANLAVGPATVFVPTGGTIVALNQDDGSQLWSHALSGSPVTASPMVMGSAVYVGSTDGTLYALNAATGTELWRVDTGSAIVTDLVNEDGVLYFANQGDGTDTGPAFIAVDTTSLGNDVLSYEVPQADTILFIQGGVTNGVVYFYGAQNVYAVNMSNVIHEFAVTSKLIVESYAIPTDSSQDPTGNDTSYRVTLTVRDEDGLARSNQPLKVWAADTLYVVNQGAPLTLTPDTPVWMATDNTGEITLAISAYDDGSATTGSPNVSLPPLYVWSNFMAAEESILIYPDHEQLTTLSNVQGTSAGLSAAAAGALSLDLATGYDGQSLVMSTYSDPTSLTNIAATVRNTIGTRNAASVGATQLISGSNPGKYVRAGHVVPNVLYTADSTASPTRPYVPGADPTFTMDLSSGLPLFTTTYDPNRPSNLPPADTALLGGIFSDIKHFASNVIKGAEQVAKLAWTFTENAVQTVIHTAESVYNLVITDVEDAVTAVTGFLKSVIADIGRVIEWLSALFDWKNMLINHTLIRQSISNPAHSTNPGILDQLSSWITSEVGGGSDTSSTLSSLTGQGSSTVTDTSSGMAGQTVQGQSAGGNNDPSTVYNYGGNNNAGQCTWMHQKVKENAANANVDLSVRSGTGGGVGVWDSQSVVTAWQNFMTSVQAALTGTFADLPSDLHSQLMSLSDNFKDPKSIISTGFSDILAGFETIADTMIDFAHHVAVDFLGLVNAVLSQLVAWLNEPIEIPFVSSLYAAITHGGTLTLLDLMCLIAAVPGTILLDVITGSPIAPTGVGLEADAANAKQILLGIAGFEVAAATSFTDLMSLYFTLSTDATPKLNAYWSKCDLAADTVSWALNMVVSEGWAEFEARDWVFWGLQALPIAGNFSSMYYTPDWTKGGADQILRDTTWGVIYVVISSVYASKWPTPYRDAVKAPGLVISGNVLNAMSTMVELLLFLLQVNTPEGGGVMIGKILFAEVSNVLGFTANVLGAVD